MPNRNLSFEAVVLRCRETPGGDRIVTFLAADFGLVDAFVFGGPKSRLRSLAAPYHAGTAWIYLDPIKDLRKLSDFDARETFPALRENLHKIWSAGYFSETMLRTDAAGGESRAAYDLFRSGLSSLNAGNEEDIDYICIQYGWRLLGIMGLLPDPTHCGLCGALSLEGQGSFFSRSLGIFRCPRCNGSEKTGFQADALPLSGDIIRYLANSKSLAFREALKVRVSEPDLPILKALVFHLVQSAAEGELRTLAQGELL